MPYLVSGCRYCQNRDTPFPCYCGCHSATQEDIEEGYGRCDPEVYD